MGRRVGLPVKERTCLVCASEMVEDEKHVLLNCISYAVLRSRMFSAIRSRTGDTYQLSQMREDHDEMMRVLLGESIPDRKHRVIVQQEVAKFLGKAMAHRKSWLD